MGWIEFPRLERRKYLRTQSQEGKKEAEGRGLWIELEKGRGARKGETGLGPLKFVSETKNVGDLAWGLRCLENFTRCKMKSKGKCLRTSACQTNIFVDFFVRVHVHGVL